MAESCVSSPGDSRTRVVLVTGAASGIGRAITVNLVREGHSVSLFDVNNEELNETVNICKQAGGDENKILGIKGDMQNDVDLETFVSKSLEKYKEIHGLVNCAGVAFFDSITKPSLEIFDKVIATNLRGPYYLTSLAVPHLAKTQGSIVNISSMNAHILCPDMLSYSMTKAGLSYFTSCLARELGPMKIRVNAVSPGSIPTNIGRKLNLSDSQKEGVAKHVEDCIPMQRHGTPTEVAESVCFLLSDKASYITGTDILVSGGLHLGAFNHLEH